MHDFFANKLFAQTFSRQKIKLILCCSALLEEFMENVSSDLLHQKLECMRSIVHSDIFKNHGTPIFVKNNVQISYSGWGHAQIVRVPSNGVGQVVRKFNSQFLLLYLRYMGGGGWLKTSYGEVLAENVRIPSYDI